MIRTLEEGLTVCSVNALTIDLPIRLALAGVFGIAPIYVAASVTAHFATCLAISQTSYCDSDDGELICQLLQGAIVYGARAGARGQSLVGRPIIGAVNKAAYKTQYANSVVIETIEGVAVEGALRLLEYTPTPFLKAAGIGFFVGTSLYTCKTLFAEPAISYISSLRNDTNASYIDHIKNYTDTIIAGVADSPVDKEEL